MRPPGYEPGELPTAPLRDIKSISQLRLQRYVYFLNLQNYHAKYCRMMDIFDLNQTCTQHYYIYVVLSAGAWYG